MQSINSKKGSLGQVVKCTSEISSIYDTAYTCSVTLRSCHEISGPRIDLTVV